MKKRIAAFSFCLFFFQICQAQILITGRIINPEGHSLQNVTVQNSKKNRSITDSSGKYAVLVSSLPAVLSFSFTGYISADISAIRKEMPPIVLFRDTVLLEAAIVKAYEQNDLQKNIPASVAILNKNSLERYSNQTFVAAINTVPGVKMDERSPGSYRLSIRGNLLRSAFGIRNVKVYWNGVPFTGANGNTYINEVPFNTIDKIEIIKGPAGSMYGPGTGGVVLLGNEFLKNKQKSVQVQTAAGSYGLFSGSAGYVSTGSNSAVALSLTHQQADGYRAHTNLRKDAAVFILKHNFNPKQNVQATVFYSDLYYQTPGGLTQAQMEQNPRQARPAAGIFGSAEDKKAALHLKTFYTNVANEILLSKNWKNTTGAYFAYTNFKNPSIRNYEKKTEAGSGLRSFFQYKNSSFTSTFGGEYQYEFTNTSTYSNKFGEADTLQYHDKIDARQYNIFMQTEFNLPAGIRATLGISYNNFYYGFVRVNQLPYLKETKLLRPQIVPRVAFLKKLSTEVNMYIAVSKGYSPPSIDEIHASDGNFNRSLNAESAINYEAGIKGNIFKEKLWIDVAFYFFNLNHTIVTRRDASGADYYANAGTTKQSGKEAVLNYLPVNNNLKFMRQLKLWVNYTNLKAKFADYQQGVIKYDGNRLTGSPPNVLVTGTDIVLANGLYANFTYSFTDKIPLNDANTFFAKHYNLLFLKTGLKTKFHKSMEADLFASYEQSFNKPYSLGNDLNAAGNRYFNPSAPVTFTIGARFSHNLK